MIKHSLLVSCLVGLLAIAGRSALAAQGQEAATLYQAHCVSCHGSEVYTREDRKIASFEALERQVQRCELSLGLRWFDDDIENVASYLNHRFYRFEP